MVARRPKQVLVDQGRGEDAAGAGVRHPDGAAGARGGVGDPDRPRFAASTGDERGRRLGRHPDEGDPRAVRREDRREVMVEARREPGDAAPAEIVDPHERVAAPVADKGQALAVRRPGQRPDVAAVGEQGLRRAVVRRPHGHDAALVDIGQPGPVGSVAGPVTRADLAQVGSVRRHGPHYLRPSPLGRAAGVGGRRVLKGRRAGEGQARRIGGPGEIADVGPVVAGEVGDRVGRAARG